MKKICFLLSILLMGACTENPEEKTTPKEQPNHAKGYLTEEKIQRYLESQLQITGNEKYTYEIYSEELNGDDSTDRIVTINLLDRAKNEAIDLGKVAKLAEMGFIGNYNYFCYIDGKTQVITSPILVASSAMAELKVSFDYVSNLSHKDIQIDYRIMSDCYRKYYTIDQRIPIQVSETEIFQNLGKDDEKAFYIRLEPNEETHSNNIVLYKGIAEKVDLDVPDAVYSVEPKIEPTSEMIRRWYYNPGMKKYYMKRSEVNE